MLPHNKTREQADAFGITRSNLPWRRQQRMGHSHRHQRRTLAPLPTRRQRWTLPGRKRYLPVGYTPYQLKRMNREDCSLRR